MGELAVADGLTGRDAAEFRPDVALEFCAVRGGWERVDGRDFPFEKALESSGEAKGIGGGAHTFGGFAVVDFQEADHAVFVIVPVGGAEGSLVVADDAQGADGRFEMVD